MAALHNFGPYNVRHNQVVRGSVPVSATLYFFDSDKNLPFEAACYISKRCSEYLVDITGTEAAERRNL